MSLAAPSTGLLVGGHERGVPLRGRITQQNALACIARLVVLATEGPEVPILMYVDSPGGSIRDSLAIISTMNGIKCPIATFCYGTAGGTAAMIFAHGTPGFRAAKVTSAFSFKGWDGVREQDFHQSLAEVVAKDAHQQSAAVLEWLREGAEFNAQQALSNGLLDFLADEPVVPHG